MAEPFFIGVFRQGASCMGSRFAVVQWVRREYSRKFITKIIGYYIRYPRILVICCIYKYAIIEELIMEMKMVSRDAQRQGDRKLETMKMSTRMLRNSFAWINSEESGNKPNRELVEMDSNESSIVCQRRAVN